MRRGDLSQLFHASPELFCDELARRLGSIEERIARLQAQAEELAEAMQTYIRQDLPAARARPDVTAWTCHAALPNRIFDTVFDAEILSTGAKRWVNATARLAARLVLPRNLQFHVEIQVMDFATPDTEASFAISADGEDLPWLTRDGRLFTTLVPARPDLATLDLVFSADPASCGGRDVSFSFQTIRVRANTAQDPA